MERLKSIASSGKQRPFVLSVAGLDPSAGAGLLADIKTFEQLSVYGLAVNTANTLQTDQHFFNLQWSTIDFILNSIEVLGARFDVAAVKIGVLPSLKELSRVLELINRLWPAAPIVWDPVIQATTGYDFFKPTNCPGDWSSVYAKLSLITPNLQEAVSLAQMLSAEDLPENLLPEEAASYLAGYCPVYLKGGHDRLKPGVDVLLDEGSKRSFAPTIEMPAVKHGSGCVLSAAITAQLALGLTLCDACKVAKSYIEKFLLSNHTQLGTHVA